MKRQPLRSKDACIGRDTSFSLTSLVETMAVGGSSPGAWRHLKGCAKFSPSRFGGAFNALNIVGDLKEASPCSTLPERVELNRPSAGDDISSRAVSLIGRCMHVNIASL